MLELELKIDDNNPVIAVGVSGGADSTALLFIAHEWAVARNGKVIGLTVNHNLRPESREESVIVGELLNKYNIEHHILDWEHSPINSNIQSKARNARLELLTNWCHANNVSHLLLAHNMNDLAETFLMHSMRGSGLYGLASIPKISVYNKTWIHRPLLGVSRDKLEKYLLSKGIAWIEDPSNSNTKFLRVKIRNIIKKENLSVNMLALSAQNLGRARNFMEIQLSKAFGKMVEIYPEGYLTIAIDQFSTLHAELALLMLSSCLTTISGSHIYKPRLRSLERVYAQIKTHKVKNDTLWGCELHTKKNILYIYREIPRNGFTLTKTSENTWMWDGRFRITRLSRDHSVTIEHQGVIPPNKNTSKRYIPKKIYKSLPRVNVGNESVLTPFIDSTKELGIEIDFYPSQPLAKIQFDY